MNDYAATRASLCTLLEELNQRLAKITEDVRHASAPVESDFAEQATQNENNEVLDQLGNAAKAELMQIRQAIERIDRGEYGICLRCGQAINPERLTALPYASLCLNCAQRANRGR